MSDVAAISGTRRTFKEMADGTIRVSIDVDPQYRARFFELFGAVDMPIALTPLVAGFEKTPVEKPKGGALAKLAGMWCHDPEFWNFCSRDVPGSVLGAETAAQYIRDTCQIESRAELDNVPYAKEMFDEFIRGKYMKWRAQRGLQ